jgi:hypothetical protein
MLCSTTAEVSTSWVADCLAYGKKPVECMTGLTTVMNTLVMGKLCWTKSFVDAVALYISLVSTSHLTSIHLYVFEDLVHVTLTILIIQRSTQKEVGRQVFGPASRMYFCGGFRRRGPLFCNCRSIAKWLALVMSSSSVAVPWPAVHWSPTPHGFCVRVETSIFVPELSYSSLPSGQHHPRQRSRFFPWARLGTVAGSPRENPRSFLGNLPGARGNNITSLIPVTSHSALTSHPCSHSQVVVSPAIDSISGPPAAREARMRRAHHEGGGD